MTERLKQELKLVEARYGELEISPNLDWFIIKRRPLGAGWTETRRAGRPLHAQDPDAPRRRVN